MTIKYYHVDAFTSVPFAGNPAGVCLLDNWLEDALLQSIAAENNLSETAFLVKVQDEYDLRWFTPEVEIDLCGHATLASAHVLFEEAGFPGNEIKFQTQSGQLIARRMDERIELNFPARPAVPCPIPPALVEGLGATPIEVFKSRDYLAVYATELEVAALLPNMAKLQELSTLGVIATARGDTADFVSRFFAPSAGVPEDPVTGSSHCTLIPFWSGRLHKHDLRAHQLSRRGGELYCRNLGPRVGIAGRAVTFLRGQLHLPSAPK
jgi:predicted PhzF superfamily epimerase YddE/YHI9